MLDVGSSYSEARHALRALCPQPLLNWREARYYGRYGEVELHLLEFLCRRDADAIDIGANDGSYVHYMRRYARHVVAYEPMPTLVKALRQKFPRGVTIEPTALSDRTGTIELRMPVVDGVVVTGCSTVSDDASAAYPAFEGIEVPMKRLDDVYSGTCGFIKIDVEGHQQAVLEGAVDTIRRCQPRMLVEVEDRLSPGGLGRARAYFDGLGYRGLFVHQGQLKPIDRFSVETMQDPANLPSLTAALTARKRFGRYIYNFIFLPPGEPESTIEKMAGRLRALAA
jgi:FkbM family methyltransferase